MTTQALEFDYDEAFSRNVGWVTEWEQQALRTKRVAIAGMGGVGGLHLLTLTRLGIGNFHVADMDVFETVNFNRQIGASTATLGCSKVDVMIGMAREINPTMDIRGFAQGISEENIDEFLDGADLFIDGFDFFALDMRAKVFARCAERGIPAITAGPIGMGAAYLAFMPQGMTFAQYFGLHDDQPAMRQYVNFLVGLTPAGLHRSYLVDPTRVDLSRQRGPSTGMACQICAGVAGIEALRILLGRDGVKAAPWFHQFDAYRGRWVSRKLRGGARNPLQRLRQKVGLRMAQAVARNVPRPEVEAPRSEIEAILDTGRWAPSGDNGQPWRFRIESEDRLTVLASGEIGQKNIYEYNNGQPTLLSVGHLLETLKIAASGFGRALHWSCKDVQVIEAGELRLEIDVHLPREAHARADALLGFAKVRSVNRTAYRRDRLTDAQKTRLAEALGHDLKVTWFESASERWAFSRLGSRATDIRLRSREAYEVHREVIDWHNRFSPAGMPGTAIGMDALTQKIMRWAMADFSRVERINYFGTGLAQLQLDLIPGLACAGHFTIGWSAPRTTAPTVEELLLAGQRIQRFWLTATSMGLTLQPGMASLIFANYAAAGTRFTQADDLIAKSHKLLEQFRGVTGSHPGSLVFMGRIGRPRSTLSTSRSHRLPLEDLIVSAPAQGSPT